MQRLKDDSGIAMMTAILVMFVLGGLSLVSFQLAGHDLEQSADDRRRVQAIHAAEAGLDRFLDYLANEAPIATPACTLPTEALTATPPANFTVTATYYLTSDGSGTAYGPSNCTPTSPPASATIRSVGESAGRRRTMEAFVELTATNGGAPLTSGAVFANNNATWNGSASVLGNPDDADLYSVGDLDLSGGGTVKGDISTQGNLTLGGTTEVKKDAVAKLSVTLKGGATVRGSARSSTSTLSNSGTIYGNAYYCSGSVPGGVVLGSKVQNCPNPTLPPVRAFPVFTYDAAAWQLQGYNTSNTFADCTAAKNFITGIAGSDHASYVVRITSTCELSLTGSQTLKGNLAIISDGSLKLAGNANIQRASGSPNPTLLFLMLKITQPLGCTDTAVQSTGSTTFGSDVHAVIYSPCDVKFAGGAFAVTGQIIANNITFSSTSSTQYQTVVVPGANALGFQEKLHYRREVTNTP